MKTSKFLTPLLALLTSTLAIAEPVVLDNIAVVVNDNVITQTQVDREINRFMSSLPPAERNIPKDAIRNEVLGSLVDEELKIQEANKRNIKIDNITLNREIEYIAAQQNLTVYELYDKVTARGLEYAEYREKLRREIAIQQIFSRVVRSRVKVSQQEITDFLNSDLHKEVNSSEYHLSHIIIDLAEGSSSEKVEKADTEINNIYEDLIKGADFAEKARKFSDSDTSLQGGNLGWLKRADLPSRFMQVILEMSNGGISKPFRTPTGFNILMLHDIRGIKKYMVDEVNVRHILVKTSQIVTEEDALDRIDKIRASIVKGEDFGKLAKELSEDKGSAVSNGDLGWAPSSAYVAEFKRLADELPLNKLSQPIKTQFGWHILEVMGRRSTDKTLEKSREDARYKLITRKAKEQEQTWINELRTRAYIDIREQRS